MNEPWPETVVDVLVSDDEPGLAEAVKAEWHQLCVLNAVKRLGFILWRDRMSLEERRMALDAIRTPLFTLVHSAEKHLVDKDMDRLRWRMDWTLTMLGEAARSLRSRGYGKAGEYLEMHAGLLVSFAELALEAIMIPYTTNRVERLMGVGAQRLFFFLFFYVFRWVTGLDSLPAIRFMPVLLNPLFVLASCYFCLEVFRNGRVVAWCGFLSATGMAVTVGLYAYFLNNLLALSLLLFSLGLLFRAVRVGSVRLLGAASVLGGLLVYTHPWTMD